MKKIAFILMILTVLSKVFGFARDIILSYFYGISNVTDAYLVSLTIPVTICAFIGMGISTSYIPMYNRIIKERDIQSANKFTNNIINFIILICVFIVLIGLVFTVQIVKIFASGFDEQTLRLAINFTQISIFGVFFSTLIYVFNGYLHIKNNYIVPALIIIPYNFFVIISIILSAKYNIGILPIGSVIAVALQLLCLVPFVYKNGYRYTLRVNVHDKYFKRMIYLSLPVIIGVSVNQVNILIDKTLASQMAVGGITALNYANRLNGFVQGIFVLSISTAMYPMISNMATENNISGLKESISEAINVVNLLILPATVGAMVFAEPLVKLLFGRGAFDYQAIYMTSKALFFYSIGMVGFALREVLSRAFYSLQDTKTPTVNAVIAMTMNIFLNIVLSRLMGIGGLALATSVSATFCAILLFISLRRKIGSLGTRRLSIKFLKILFASLLMGIIASLLFNMLVNYVSQNLALVVAIGIGAISYLGIIYFMKIEDLNIIVNTLRQKTSKAIV